MPVARQHRFDATGRAAQPRFVNAQHEIADLPVAVAKGGRVEARSQEVVNETFAGPLVVNEFFVEVGLLEANCVVNAGDRVVIVMVARAALRTVS